jgi:AcrR family transcriptional regulator
MTADATAHSSTGDIADRIVAAALVLAADKGWRRLTIAEVGETAGVTRADLARHAPDKPALLDAFARMIDRAVLSDPAPGPDEPARDRLFDLLMRRFDALSLHRAGAVAILRDLRTDPAAALMQAKPLERSMRWTLEAAGIGTRGLAGALRIRALSVLYLVVLRVWERDDSEDLARTMKALDTRLRQAEQLENSVGKRLACGPSKRRAKPEAEAEASAPAST